MYVILDRCKTYVYLFKKINKYEAIILNISVEESIKELQEDIIEKQNQIELIKNIDWNKPVDEKTWHEICETPLRTSNLLCSLVKNTFSDAEDIIVSCNYVFFKLYDFRCALPTSRCDGIYIETGWYQKDNGQPTLPETISQYHMRRYFQLKDNKENWEVLFDERLSSYKSYKKWIKFIMWFGHYKWKKVNREKWEKIFTENQNKLDRMINEYNQTRKEMYEKTKIMVEIVIPELKKFSMKVYKLKESDLLTPQKIAELEGFKIPL